MDFQMSVLKFSFIVLFLSNLTMSKFRRKKIGVLSSGSETKNNVQRLQTRQIAEKKNEKTDDDSANLY